MSRKCHLSFLALVIAVFFTNCSDDSKPIDGVKSKVVKVITGNKIELQNGLTVELLGIKATEDTKEYLEKMVLGETVTLAADSKQKRKVNSYKTTVKAYAKLDRGYCLSGSMLKKRIAELHQTGAKYDSLANFTQYIQDEMRATMSLPELKIYLKPRTFRIELQEGGHGTGFFINDNGLALTNHHVLDGSMMAYAIPYGENGEYDQNNIRPIKSIITTYKEGLVDYTIFYVNLNNGEKVKYVPLAKQREKEGGQLAKLGSPLDETENFQSGILSTYFDGYFSHSCGTSMGDSGGPVVNMRGEAVGINVAEALSERGTTTIKYAVDVLPIRELLDENNIEYGR